MKTIFIVDDKATNLMLAKKTLDSKFRTYAFQSAEMMFKLLDKITPNLILLDIEMPDMNGFEVLKQLKAHEKYQYIPVMFLTKKNDPDHEIYGFELGAIDFITKPFTAPVLLKRVEAHIEIDNLTREVQQKNENLTKSNEAKDNILAIVSHDLKNCFGSILSAVEIIQMKHKDFAKNKYLEVIEEVSNRALFLMQDLLNTNKLEADSDNLTLSKQNINDLIIDNIDNILMMAKQKKIELILETSDEPIFCEIHCEKFQRAIENLCINAIKFTNHHGKITIKTQVIDNLAQIHVIDTGIGMSEDIKNKLFKKYSDAGRKGTAGEASTGLGLYIVSKIISQLKGTIDVTSEVGVGSEFVIKLPVV